MAHARTALRRAARAARVLRNRVTESPNRHVRWLPAQLAFLSDPSRKKLMRTGNQSMGKTTAGLAEVNFRCLGRHPFLESVRQPPIEAWIICSSWSQSVAIQEKFWQTVDRRDLVAGTSFSKKNGFNAKSPMVEYLNGSVVRFKTTGQDGLDLSGATIDVAMFDEPPKSERVYGEIVKRVMKRRGVVLLTLTPINAPCDWLKELCEAGAVEDHHFRLEPKHLIPVGYSEPIRLEDGTPCDADWVAEVIAETLPHEVPVTCHGEWEMKVKGSVLRAFKPQGEGAHVVEVLPDDDLELRLGIDHGSGLEFSAVAVLTGVVKRKGQPAVIWALDEYVSDGETTEDQDAEAIARMLIRNSITWRDLHRVFGDRPWAAKRAARINRKSNAKLMQALCRLPSELRLKAGIPSSGVNPKIETVKRGEGHGAGSVHVGVEYLHKAMVRDAFRINTRCVRGVESLTKWDGPSGSEWKHWIDGLRYALDDLIFERRLPTGIPEVRIG